MPDETTGVLQHTRVLVTRSVHQADTLSQLIEQEGGEVVRFPAIEIIGPADEAALNELIDRLADFDIAIFISPNAVSQAVIRIKARRGDIPEAVRLACVGAGSARKLKRLGYKVDITPKNRFRSESLLRAPKLQDVRNKNIIIFRGQGGRTLLADTLTTRGAQVTYAECYRRIKPDTDTTTLEQQWADNGVDIVTVTSVEILQNLCDMLTTQGRQLLRTTPIVVIGQRAVAACRELKFQTTPIVATEASDQAIVDAVKAWRAQQNTLYSANNNDAGDE